MWNLPFVLVRAQLSGGFRFYHLFILASSTGPGKGHGSERVRPWAEIDSWGLRFGHASERLLGLSSQDGHQGRLFLGPLRASIFVNPLKDTDSGRFHQRYGSNPLTPCCPLVRQISRTEKAFEFSFMRNSRADSIFSFGGLCYDFRYRNKEVLRLDRALCWLNRWNSGDSFFDGALNTAITQLVQALLSPQVGTDSVTASFPQFPLFPLSSHQSHLYSTS